MAKLGVKEIPVSVRLRAVATVIPCWDGINHKLVCGAMTWIMRKVGHGR